MSKIKKILKYITDKNYRTIIKCGRGRFNNMPDKEFLEMMFKVIMGKELDLDNPKTINEKLQWLKLYNRKPEYTMMADKYLVRDYIAKELGEEYLIPLLGVWDSPDEIDFDALPNQFVLKCNHNSGVGMCICKDKSKLDIDKVKSELKKGLEQDYYLLNREWPYKDIKRKIIAEKFMVDDKTKELRDYKFFCFDGEMDCCMVCLDRQTGTTKFYYMDNDWNLMRHANITGREAPEDFKLDKPENYDEMEKIACKLSKGMPFSRIDLYNVNGKIYFGEITFFPDSGFDDNITLSVDEHWGKLLKLPEKTQEQK